MFRQRLPVTPLARSRSFPRDNPGARNRALTADPVPKVAGTLRHAGGGGPGTRRSRHRRRVVDDELHRLAALPAVEAELAGDVRGQAAGLHQ